MFNFNKIFESNKEDIELLCSYIKTIRNNLGSINYDKKYSLLKLYDFNFTLKRILYKFDIKLESLNIFINFDNIKFFGIYTHSEILDIFKFLSSSNEFDYNPCKKITVEIDNLLLSSEISELSIVKLIIIEIMLNYSNYEEVPLIKYILSKISYSNKTVNVNYINSILVNYVCSMYIFSKYSTFRAVNCLYNSKDKNEMYGYDVINIVFSNCEELIEFMYNNKLVEKEVDFNGFNCINILDFISDVICTEGDSNLYNRMKVLKTTTSINSIKGICDKCMKDISAHYENITENLKSSLSNIKDKSVSKFNDIVKINKIKNFNDVYQLYYNRYYELEIRSTNVDDEYTALSIIRDINSVISVISQYINDNVNSEVISKDSLKLMSELHLKYINLRSEITKKKIPKYSTLGIWIPKDYNKNPYDL